MHASLVRSARAIVGALTAWLCVAGPAQAVFYSGAWDPIYGMPFVGGTSPLGFELGWRGNVNVFVPDSCALGSGARNYGPFSSCTQNSYVQSASVEFYDALNSSIVRGTITFGTGPMAIGGLHFVDNDLLSLVTLTSSWEQASWNSPFPPTSPFFSLLFVDAATSNWLRSPLGRFFGDIFGLRDEIPSGYEGPLLLSHPNTDFDSIDSLHELFRGLHALGEISISDVKDNPPTYPNGRLFSLAATAVPEPGSLALVALALLTATLVVRLRPSAS